MKTIIPIISILVFSSAICEARRGQKHGKLDGYVKPKVFSGNKSKKTNTSSSSSGKTINMSSSKSTQVASLSPTSGVSNRLVSSLEEGQPIPGSKFAAKLRQAGDKKNRKRAPGKREYENEFSSSRSKSSVNKNSGNAPTGSSGGGNGDEFALEVNYEGVNEEGVGVEVQLIERDGQEYLVAKETGEEFPVTRLPQNLTNQLWDQSYTVSDGSNGRGIPSNIVNGGARPNMIGLDLGAPIDIRRAGVSLEKVGYYNASTDATEDGLRNGTNFAIRNWLIEIRPNGRMHLRGGGGGGGGGEAPGGGVQNEAAPNGQG